MSAKRLTAREAYEAGEQRISLRLQSLPKIGKSREGTAATNRELIRTLQACYMARFPPTKELIERIARQLGVSIDKHGGVVSKPRNTSRAKSAYRQAMALLASDGKLSSRKVARLCKVSVPTVSKWRQGITPEEEIRRDFEVEARRVSEFSDFVSDLSEANLW